MKDRTRGVIAWLMGAWLVFAALMAGSAWGATRTLGPGGTYPHMEDLVGVLQTGDVISVTQSYNDSSLYGVKLQAAANVTFELNGFTITHVTANDSMLVLGSGWTIQNGAFLKCKPIIHSAGGTLTVSNVDFQATTGATTMGLIRSRDSGRAMTITNCDFTEDGTASYLLPYVAQGVNYKLTVRGCTFTDGGYGVQFLNAANTAGSTIDDCDFRDNYNAGIYVAATPSRVAVDSCNFYLSPNVTLGTGGTGSVLSGTKAIYYALGTTAGAVSGGTITNCLFDDWKFLAGSEADTAQGDSITVEDCTFQGYNTSVICEMRANHGIIRDCTFHGTYGYGWGTKTNGPHALMVGADGGYDCNDGAAADSILVTGCTFDINRMPVHATPIAYYPCASKSNNPRFVNNTFEYTYLDTLSTPIITPTFISLRGARNARIYNNEFVANNDSISVFYTLTQAAGKHTKATMVYNNKIRGNYQNLFYMAGTAQDSSQVFDHNYYADGAAYDSVAVVKDATESAWWGDANFTDATSWRMDWGGQAGLQGMTDSAQGFQRVGISTDSPGQPAIARQQPGFRTPKEALESIRSIGGLTGVELDAYVVNPQDRGNLDVWQFAPHGTGNGTLSEVANDTLRVRAAFQ